MLRVVVSKLKMDVELPAPPIFWKSCNVRGFNLSVAEGFVALIQVCFHEYYFSLC